MNRPSVRANGTAAFTAVFRQVGILKNGQLPWSPDRNQSVLARR
jgi:hypothetical protein